MSIGNNDRISISVKENGRADGVRTIEGYVLEIPDTLPRESIEYPMEGIECLGFNLSVAEAEELYDQLGKSLAFIKPLLADGRIKEAPKSDR